MSITTEAPTAKKIKLLRIMPFFATDLESDGIDAQLAKYSMVLHEGANYREPLTYLERNGVRRYLTGLDEFAPEVQRISDPSEKAAVIKDIRTKVIFIEKALGSNTIDIKDDKFWDKVKYAHPTNYKFWDDVYIQPGNEPVFLNPEDPYDLLKICGIQAGGFSICAKSYEDARLAANPPKFYLDKETDTASSKVEIKKIKNKAIAYLDDLSENNPKKLFYIIKNVDTNPSQYKKDTSVNIIYEYLDNYISGLAGEKSVKKASTFFNSLCEMSDEDIRIKAVIADASFYKTIAMKGDGLLWHLSTETMLGKNAAEVLTFYKNPLNSKVWDKTLEEITAYWND